MTTADTLKFKFIGRDRGWKSKRYSPHMRSLWYIHLFYGFLVNCSVAWMVARWWHLQKKTELNEKRTVKREAANVCTILINRNIWPNKSSTVIKHFPWMLWICTCTNRWRCEVFEFVMFVAVFMLAELCRDAAIQAPSCNKWLFNDENEMESGIICWLLVHIDPYFCSIRHVTVANADVNDAGEFLF